MKPQPWSHSRLNALATCPRQFHAVQVVKRIPRTSGVEADWGNTVHEAIDLWFKTDVWNDILNPYKARLDEVKNLSRGFRVMSENDFSIDRHLEPCSPTDWDRVWCRAKLDLILVNADKGYALIKDWKTGKVKDDPEQLVLYALLAFIYLPEVNVVHCNYEWLKFGRTGSPATFERKDVPAMWATLTPKLIEYARSFREEDWKPKPSGLCRGWCPVNDCEFWSEKKPVR